MNPMDTLGLTTQIVGGNGVGLFNALMSAIALLISGINTLASHKYNAQHIAEINAMKFDAFQKETSLRAEITALKNELDECKDDFERHKKGEN
jgi:hypothetical protein